MRGRGKRGGGVKEGMVEFKTNGQEFHVGNDLGLRHIWD